MCKHHDDPLDDDLDDFLADFDRQKIDAPKPQPVPAPVRPQVFIETCAKCRGTGRFVGYSGRVLGQCFACKGKGKFERKTSPEQRAKGRESAERARQRKQEELLIAKAQWIADHAVEWQWIVERAMSFDFAQSMNEAVAKYGYLTEGQLAAVRRCVVRDEEREARRRQEREEREARASAIDISAIHEAFAKAQENGIRRPKLRLDTFTFSLAKDGSTIYVKEGKGFDDPYMGKVVGGRFFRSRECTDEQEQRILAAAADPAGSAIAYGRRYGACSICGRELTNHESIDRGIGPICAERYGF